MTFDVDGTDNNSVSVVIPHKMCVFFYCSSIEKRVEYMYNNLQIKIAASRYMPHIARCPMGT